MVYKYEGDLKGSRALGSITFEMLYSYMLMTGEIRSNQASYLFSADIYGTNGYGEMLDQYWGGQFPIQIQNLTMDGFILILNPLFFPTNYYFRRLI